MPTFVQILDFIGTFAFAISGIRLASAKRFDWFGAYVVGLATAIGGGTIRDVLLDVTPGWMTDPIYLICTGLAFKIFTKLAAKEINVDIILQSIGRNNTKDISFTIPESQLDETMEILRTYVETIGAADAVYDGNVSKVSVVGAGMETHPGVAAQMFEALFDANINIQMISTSEIKISVLIARDDADQAVTAIHKKFFSGK